MFGHPVRVIDDAGFPKFVPGYETETEEQIARAWNYIKENYGPSHDITGQEIFDKLMEYLVEEVQCHRNYSTMTSISGLRQMV